MINQIFKKIFNRNIISQYYFENYHKFFLKKSVRDLFENGYKLYDHNFDFQNLNLERYLNYPDYNFVMDRKKIDDVDLKKIYKVLLKNGAISLIKDYLGKSIYCYDNSILTLGNKVSQCDSMQPHHDSKLRRLKVYIWLSNKNFKTHPLYYLRKTHKQIKNWQMYKETRYPNEKKNKFDTIYGDKGNIIFFDTNGIHSHYKTTNVPRSVIELTFESFGFLSRLNNKNIKTETTRLNLINLDELIY